MVLIRLTRCRVAAAIILIIAAACGAAAWWMRFSNRLLLRNASGAALGEIHVVARHLDGRVAIDRTVASLAAGSSATIRHALNDSRVTLEFQMLGAVRHLDLGYIDLWKGEGWVIEIQADGSVQQGYDR